MTETTGRPSAADDSPPKHVPTRGLYGWITHTEFASADPAATRAWCAAVLGWEFRPPFAMGGNEYHLFAYSTQGGGGVHRRERADEPGSVPYVHVEDAQASFDAALRAGAEALMPPTRVAEGVTLAMVRAPGGVTIGLSGP
jgi:uncharacterized protein